MSFITYKQKKVAFEYQGEGTPIVLLHGFCEDSTMWAEFKPLLSKKYSILTIDLAGFGQSGLISALSIGKMAEAVQAVLEHLSIERPILIGHSMGGYVGLAFAEQHPNTLRGLGLFHSHPFADSEEKITNRIKTIRFIERHGVAPFAGHFVRNLFAADFVQQNATFVEDLIHQTSSHCSDAVIAASYAMLNRPNRSKVLTNLACPALFIVGKQDNAIKEADSLQQLVLPQVASAHIFDDVGHMGMFERPKATAAIVNQFADFCVRMG